MTDVCDILLIETKVCHKLGITSQLVASDYLIFLQDTKQSFLQKTMRNHPNSLVVDAHSRTKNSLEVFNLS